MPTILLLLFSFIMFVFVLPASTDTLISLLSGYIFYLFAKEIFIAHGPKKQSIESRILSLKERMSKVPHRTATYIYDRSHEKEREDEKKEQGRIYK